MRNKFENSTYNDPNNNNKKRVIEDPKTRSNHKRSKYGSLTEQELSTINSAKELMKYFSDNQKYINGQFIASFIQRITHIFQQNDFEIFSKEVDLVLEGALTVKHYTVIPISLIFNSLSKWPAKYTNNASFIQLLKTLAKAAMLPDILRKFNERGICNVFNAISKWPHLLKQDIFKQLIYELADQAKNDIHSFKGQGITTIFNAVSKWYDSLPIEDPLYSFLRLLAENYYIYVNNMGHNQIFTLYDSVRSMVEIPFLADVQKDLLRKLNSIKQPQEKAIIESDYNIIKKLHNTMSLLAYCLNNLETLGPNSLATTLSNISKDKFFDFLKHQDAIFKLVNLAIKNIDKFNMFTISLTLKALSRWNINRSKHSEKFNNYIIRIAAHILETKMISKFNNIGIGELVSSLTKWSHLYREEKIKCLVNELAHHVYLNVNINKFDEQGVTIYFIFLNRWFNNTRTLPRYLEYNLKELTIRAKDFVESFHSREVAEIFGGLTAWNTVKSDKHLFEEFANAIIPVVDRKLNSYNEVELVYILHAFSRWPVKINNIYFDTIIKLAERAVSVHKDKKEEIVTAIVRILRAIDNIDIEGVASNKLESMLAKLNPDNNNNNNAREISSHQNNNNLNIEESMANTQTAPRMVPYVSSHLFLAAPVPSRFYLDMLTLQQIVYSSRIEFEVEEVIESLPSSPISEDSDKNKSLASSSTDVTEQQNQPSLVYKPSLSKSDDEKDIANQDNVIRSQRRQSI